MAFPQNWFAYSVVLVKINSAIYPKESEIVSEIMDLSYIEIHNGD